ncbi:MAG: hypothetical protein FWE06_04995 [Oscillospiraceae bacterium]|nr:hypothetical protein [Oscillospiraceae bacterium]
MLQEVSAEAMRFMRGKYALDEVGNGVDELAFCDNGETICTIRIYDDRYDFHINNQCISVADLDTLETVKALILVRKKPNRKPFPTTHFHVGKCGHRCDLCIHYKGQSSVSDERLEYSWQMIKQLYGGEGEREVNCGGCGNDNGCGSENCISDTNKVKPNCKTCANRNNCNTRTAGWVPEIHTRTITADQVTWAILPYVVSQYGN